jgi:peptidoglycan hydrolase CwlO-like protein
MTDRPKALTQENCHGDVWNLWLWIQDHEGRIETLEKEEKQEMAEIDDLNTQVTAAKQDLVDVGNAITKENATIASVQAQLAALQAQLAGQPALLAAVEKAATDLGTVNTSIEAIVQPILNPPAPPAPAK